MTFSFRKAFRVALGLLALVLMGTSPLRAQLDPRLQTASTDFLDLYQKSTTAKVKPEILTLFDFSGSMKALMFHPAYRNEDINDSGFPGSTLSFKLAPGTAGSRTFTITATSRMDKDVYAQWVVNLGSASSSGGNSGSNTTSSWWVGRSYYELYTSIDNITQSPSGSTSEGTEYTFTTRVTLSAKNVSSRKAVALSNYPGSLDGGIDWTVDDGTNVVSSGSTSAIPVASQTSWTSAYQGYKWTAVASKGTDGVVSASFNQYTAATCNQLIKPNGQPVTTADARAANTTLLGGSYKENDVRNWVRAASHARFVQYDNGVKRTLDIPIVWKVLDANSSGNPLSSMTVSDAVKTETRLDGTTTTWGSGQDIEVDQAYKINGGQEILTGDGTQQLTASLNHVGYHYNYLNFLFTGKYLDGTYQGKYIAFDAAGDTAASMAGGQDNATWGQAFGSGIPAGQTLTVPFYEEALNGVARRFLGEKSVKASSYVIPSRTRVQALKEAAIRVWIKYQNDVFWAFRYLEAGSGANSMTNKSTDTLTNVALPDDTRVCTGSDTAWVVLNGASTAGMQRISYMLEGTSTPLTYAVSNSLAQFTDPNNVFNALETGSQKPSQCQNHYLIVFTDGADNTGKLTNVSPYLDATTLQGAAWSGNRDLLNNKTGVNQGAGGTNYWNLYTFAGIAAHLSDSSVKQPGGPSYFMSGVSSYTSSSATRDKFLPYSIFTRGASGSSDFVTFDKPHRITTMTVGVSLGGTYKDPNSPKYRLFAAAALGDPTTQSWNLNSLAPFDWQPDPLDPNRKIRKANTTNFFDGSDPESLVQSLDIAIQQATQQSNINSTSNPNLPFIGAALGKQIILGKFKPPQNGGAIWPGDLLMFGTREVNGQTVIVDRAANPTVTLDSTTAAWSAATSLANRKWSDRVLYTRIPGSSSTPEPGLSSFTYLGTPFTDPTTGLKNFVSPSIGDDTTRQTIIQFAAGADTTGAMDAGVTPARPTNNRSSIMGDIINSAPTALEYTFSDVQSKLTKPLSGVSGGNRFRLILVGTNQGWLHGFGEVTHVSTVKDSGGTDQELVQGQVDELWSFMPTDFLSNLGYLTQTGNSHRFMVDGSPSIYFLDLPPASGGSGNGKLDKGGADPAANERAIAIIGLRRGGRSYYALDIRDPFTPVLKWSLVPDEAAYFPPTRIENSDVSLATVQNILKNWGFSSCTPSLGRILYKGTLRDAVFLGGGDSVSEVEVNFKDAQGKSIPLGRSVIALDVYTGKVLAAVDMSGLSQAPGPISTGLVPFEFVLNSGMAQRAYFMDAKGGLWSWAQQATIADSKSAYYNYRYDSSDISTWTLRKVTQDTSTNALYTTMPTPFRVGTYPGPGKDGKPTPAAVGIAMVSGDRNDPLDRKTSTSLARQNRLTVVFDRQDHKVWDSSDGIISDTSSLMDAYPSGKSLQAGDAVITPGNSNYYLGPYDSGTKLPTTPKLGYYRNFPAYSDGFVPKGINTPSVVGGALFYAYFAPLTADVCTGGTGKTYSNLICDLYNPIISDNRTGLDCLSGNRFVWTGVASDFLAVNTNKAIQAGVVEVTNPQPGASTTTMQIQTLQGNKRERFPKVRVWRTVH